MTMLIQLNHIGSSIVSDSATPYVVHSNCKIIRIWLVILVFHFKLERIIARQNLLTKRINPQHWDSGVQTCWIFIRFIIIRVTFISTHIFQGIAVSNIIFVSVNDDFAIFNKNRLIAVLFHCAHIMRH